MKPKARVAHLVIIAAAVTLLPLGLFTGYLGVLALGEGSLLRDAPPLPSADIGAGHNSRINGEFYKVQGPVEGDLLNPPEYPEVKDALWYRVTMERRTGVDATWRRDNSGVLTSDRVSHLRVGDVSVELNSMTRLSLPLAESFRPLNEHARYAIQSKPAPKDGAVFYGIYRHGTLKDGIFDRLLILSAAEQESTIANIEKKAYKKAFFLCGISLVFLGLSFVIARAAWRGQVRTLS
jgi:hypothetical protein